MAQARLARELTELETSNAASIDAMERELQGRKEGELHRATQRLKRELIDAAFTRLAETLQASPDPARQQKLLDELLNELDARA